MKVQIVTPQNKLEYVDIKDICSISIFNGTGDANKVAFAYTNQKNHLLTLSGCFPNLNVYNQVITEFFKGSNFYDIYNQYFINPNKLAKVEKLENRKKLFKLKVTFNNGLINEILLENNKENNKLFLKLYEQCLLNSRKNESIK